MFTLEEARRRALAEGDADGGQFGDEALAIRAGQFPRNATSTGGESGRLVKAGAGTLYGFSGYSSRASGQFIQVHDAASLDTLAAGSRAVVVVAVTAASNFSYDAGLHGRRFLKGIVIVNSTTAAGYTAGGADTLYDVQYV